MIKQPPHLKKGDKIAIVCPAKKLPKKIDSAIEILKSWGLEVIIGKSVYASHHQFAGTDNLRAADIQGFLDDPEIKAIIAGRGGYGTIRIIDDLDFSKFNHNPKWVIGFSDITVLLSHILSTCNTQSLHAQMPYTFDEATPESISSLKDLLFGEKPSIKYTSEVNCKDGQAQGVLIGGNLTLLCAVQGSVSEMDFTDKILFLEDVGEQEYSIDRMMRILKRAGKLKDLKGLIIGEFNEISEEKIPFGQTVYEVICEIVKDYSFPIAYNFPTGHINNNFAMALGAEIKLNIDKNNINFKYI